MTGHLENVASPSSTADSSSMDKGHKCPTCGNKFVRREHLRRHLRSHTSEKPFKCATCAKSFGRMDVLSRHLASHEPRSEAPAVCSRACYQCAATRVRCSKEEPCCKRCSQRRLKCHYPQAQASIKDRNGRVAGSGSDLDMASEPRDSTVMSVDDASTERNKESEEEETNDESRMAEDSSVVAASGQPLPQTTFDDPGPASDNYPDAVGPASALGSGNNMYEVGYRNDFPMPDYYHERAMDVMATNWISSSYQGTTDFNDQWPGLNFADATGNLSVPFFFPMVQPSLNSNIVCDSLPAGSPVRFQPVQTSPLASVDMMPNTTGHSGVGTTSSPASTGAASNRSINRYYVEGEGARQPFHGNRTHSANESSNADNVRTPSVLSNSATCNLQGTPPQLCVADMVSVNCHNAMIRGIQTECEQQSAHVDWSTLPSLNQVKELVGLYYEKFHPMFPFLPREGLLTGSENDWMLVLAIAAVAAAYDPGLRTSPMGTALPFLLRIVTKGYTEKRHSQGQGLQWDPSFMQRHVFDSRARLAALQAAILNVFCMLRSGDEALMRSVVLENQRLVECCRSCCLLSKSESTVDLNGHPQSESRPRHHRIGREANVKAGMMIWLLDSITSYQLDRQPLMRIDDMQAPLPREERPREGSRTLTLSEEQEQEPEVTILDVLEILHIEKKLPPNLHDLSITFIIYAVCRNLKDIFRDTQIQLRTWTPTAQIQSRTSHITRDQSWPPSTTLLSDWRNSACDCLDILHWRANSKIAAAAGWEHANVLHLHLARLILLTPMTHIQVLAVASTRGSEYSNGLDNSRLIKARSHVLQWALRDEHKARLALVHAGALLWHIRRFSSYSFLEPFSIYISTLVVWAYSQCHHLSGHDDGLGSQLAGGLRASNASLDCSTNGGTVSPSASASASATAAAAGPGPHEEDEMESGSEPCFIQLDRPCDDEIVQAFVRLGSKMSAHMQGVGNIHKQGSSWKVLREGLRLLLRGLKGASDLSSIGMGSNMGCAEGVPVLDLEYSYAKVLRDMGQRQPV